MSSLKSFRSLLSSQAKAPSIIGKVTEVMDNSARVQIGGGVSVVARDPTTALSVGDEVLIQSGMIRGRVRKSSSVPVYYV